jgi:hypothetical protein
LLYRFGRKIYSGDIGKSLCLKIQHQYTAGTTYVKDTGAAGKIVYHIQDRQPA